MGEELLPDEHRCDNCGSECDCGDAEDCTYCEGCNDYYDDYGDEDDDNF